MRFAAANRRLAASYREEEDTLLVLTGEGVGGAGLYEKGIWKPSASLLAWVDDGGLHKAEGRPCSLCWLAEEKDRGDWVHHLKSLTIYRVRCRKHRQVNSWLLLEVLERDLRHPALDQVLTDYSRPVVFTDPLCGIFTLERQFDWFTGQVEWLGETCLVYLACDEREGETAAAALAAFTPIYQAAAAWDSRFRAFAAGELAGLASDWQEKAVTEEEFARRISISEFSMASDGSYTVYYDDGDLFYGHVIVITGSVERGPEDAEIAG